MGEQLNSNFIERLKCCKSILEIFELVKVCVERILNLSRGGIMIGLQELPSQLLSYHPIGSNIIVLNKGVISRAAYLVENQEVLNSLLFYAILREYLRSLGITDESLAKDYVSEICEKVFGDEHILTLIAKNGLETIIPELADTLTDSDYSMIGDILILKGSHGHDLSYV